LDIDKEQGKIELPSYLTKGQAAFGGLIILTVSIFVGAALTLLVLPFLFGLNPLTFYSGSLSKGSGNKTIIQTERKVDPVVAIAKKVKPVVVNIKVKKISQGFFGEQDVSEGVGSGVVFRKDGYIITNNHVVDKADDITVTLGNDKDVKGKVVGTDSEYDIAVVKVAQDNLPVADIGNPAKLKVGQLVVAVGSPLSFEHTVTSGIVSALNRPIEIPDVSNQTNKTFTDLIQTDAAINPGNSGGALANDKGEIVGINTLIASSSGGSQGIGFAIPITRALDAAKQLMTLGTASHPYVGMVGETIDKDFAEQNNLSVESGVYVRQVVPSSPAHKAGLRANDIITEAGGNKIKDMEGLLTIIRRQKVGDKLSITYLRDKKEGAIKIVVAEKPRSMSQ